MLSTCSSSTPQTERMLRTLERKVGARVAFTRTEMTTMLALLRRVGDEGGSVFEKFRAAAARLM
ncbi:MAG: hypothetical protein FWF28_10770 [Micrococcales bacterium]|nr:hypothetical protein [Micrococcales bacterium]